LKKLRGKASVSNGGRQVLSLNYRGVSLTNFRYNYLTNQGFVIGVVGDIPQNNITPRVRLAGAMGELLPCGGGLRETLPLN